MPDDKPIALDAYEKMAERFDTTSDTNPYNAYYERPAMLGLLPDVDGLRVLDAGCGPGWYSTWLLDHGARVVGCDVSPKMIELARQRTGDRAELHVANLGQPLDFLETSTFDLIVSALAMGHIRDWAALLREFSRVLKPGGLLVFSVEHPFADYVRRESEDYFAVEEYRQKWRSMDNLPVPAFRRPLGMMIGNLAQAGFVIERLIEPLPTEECKQIDPMRYTEMLEFPSFLCIRAQRNSEKQ
jgi:SAM-dependent methyltransferase